jgi:hypothetical protein
MQLCERQLRTGSRIAWQQAVSTVLQAGRKKLAPVAGVGEEF